MKDFQGYEDEARGKFEQLLISSGITNYEFPNDPYAHYDCKYYNADNELRIVELKLRAKRYEKYDDMLLQKDKYIALHEEMGSEDKAKILYVNCYTGSDTFKVADITHKDYTWQIGNFQYTQCAERDLTQKQVTYVTEYSNITI